MTLQEIADVEAELRRREEQHAHGDRTKSETYGEAARMVGALIKPKPVKKVIIGDDVIGIGHRQLEPGDTVLMTGNSVSCLNGVWTIVDSRKELHMTTKLFGRTPVEYDSSTLIWRIPVADGTPRFRLISITVQDIGGTWSAMVGDKTIGNAYSSLAAAVEGIERTIRNDFVDAAELMGLKEEVLFLVTRSRTRLPKVKRKAVTKKKPAKKTVKKIGKEYRVVKKSKKARRR